VTHRVRRVIVFNTTFNNISVISLRPVLLVEVNRVLGESHHSAASLDKLYHVMLYRVNLAWARFELTTFVVIGTDYIGNCISNYYVITTTNAPVSPRMLVLIDVLMNINTNVFLNIMLVLCWDGVSDRLWRPQFQTWIQSPLTTKQSKGSRVPDYRWPWYCTVYSVIHCCDCIGLFQWKRYLY
jgi:hypothetical protein